MACPTCSHTMQKLASDQKHLWWCPRCGTLKEVVGHLGREYTNAEAPKLVERVRQFVRMIDGGPAGRFLREQAEVSGVLESTLPPHERPAVGEPIPLAPLTRPARALTIDPNAPEKP